MTIRDVDYFVSAALTSVQKGLMISNNIAIIICYHINCI